MEHELTSSWSVAVDDVGHVPSEGHDPVLEPTGFYNVHGRGRPAAGSARYKWLGNVHNDGHILQSVII